MEAPLVLIVDDDVSVRRSTARLLRSSGMRAEGFASAQHLLDSENTVEADCLIIDVRMPGLDGYNYAPPEGKQPAHSSDFFSGRLPKKMKTGTRAGALAFWKPVGKGALLRLIQMALERQSMRPDWPGQTKRFGMPGHAGLSS